MTEATTHECGKCQVCCEYLPVLPLEKPPQTKCPNQCAAGCRIYDDRPSCCDTYQCAFSSGILPDKMKFRPDKSHVLLEEFTAEQLGLRILMGDELKRGAIRTFIRAWDIPQGTVVVIRPLGGSEDRYFGHPDEVVAIRAALSRPTVFRMRG